MTLDEVCILMLLAIATALVVAIATWKPWRFAEVDWPDGPFMAIGMAGLVLGVPTVIAFWVKILTGWPSWFEISGWGGA